jgi:CRP/FNR family transcriptional regulator, cyclic AMP receptor protein
MASRTEMLERLGNVGLFDALSKKDLRSLLDAAKATKCPEGKVIVTEGEQAGVGLHIVLEGKVKVSKGGRTRATLGPGAYFGEISLIDGGPRTATVTAVTSVRMLSITAWAFSSLLNQNPAIARKLLVELCKRIRQNDLAMTD